MSLRSLRIGVCAVVLGASASAAWAGPINLVNNPDFQLGNVGFTSDYGWAPSVPPAYIYGICSTEGVYDIVADPASCHTLWSSFGDHTTGTGNMMVVNGSVVQGPTVWQQSNIAIDPNAHYVFSAWLASVHPWNPATLTFSINGAPVGSTIQLTDTTGLWTQFSADWNSGAATTATIALVNSNLIAQGNDFAIDDISFVDPPPPPADAVPEPATLTLLGIGLAGSALRRSRRSAA